MNPNLIIGAIFLVVIAFAAYKSIKSMKNNSCPGCGGACSDEKKKSCHH